MPPPSSFIGTSRLHGHLPLHTPYLSCTLQAPLGVSPNPTHRTPTFPGPGRSPPFCKPFASLLQAFGKPFASHCSYSHRPTRLHSLSGSASAPWGRAGPGGGGGARCWARSLARTPVRSSLRAQDRRRVGAGARARLFCFRFGCPQRACARPDRAWHAGSCSSGYACPRWACWEM